MFRLEYLKLEGHPQLGDIELYLSERNELKEISKPYTSVIIGPNGTGKSYILRTIAEIFKQFETYSRSEKKEFNLPFGLHLRYKFYHNTYEIVTRKLKFSDSKGGQRRNYLFFKNRPFDKPFISMNQTSFIITGFEVQHQELEYPEKLLVNSVIPTDRFIQQNSKPGDFYQYLGVRSTRSTTSTKSSVRRTIKHVFNAANANVEFLQSLKDLLVFLEFEESFKVNYITRINRLFFSGSLNIENFKKFFEEWWEETFDYTSRKKDNPLWSIPYYDKYFKQNENGIHEIVNYLNSLYTQKNKLQHKAKSSAKILSVDLFDTNISEYDLKMISHLESLDIINLEGLKVKKSNSTLSISDVSSGEYHLLISLIGIFANISPNSLVLIDEPEISLHPNWQMRYISFLKKVFSKFSSCQFILATHSHFIVSDLEGDSSSVTALSRDSESNKLYANLLEGINTFGWSAEDVLYNVFQVSSTRNYYIAVEIGEILKALAKKEIDIFTLKTKESELNKIKASLKPNDPLKSLIEKIQKEFLNV